MVADGIDAACHAAQDDQSTRCEITSQALSHLGSVKGRPPGPYDAEAGHVQDLRIAPQIEEHWRIINLQ
jgi:hypothetical protein